MFGLIVIVAIVTWALFVTVRTYTRLSALSRIDDPAEYNAALDRFPGSLIGGPLGFRKR